MMRGLSDNLEIRYANAGIAAGPTIDDNSTIIDMAGYESAMFVTPILDSVATGVAALTIEENDDNSDTGMAAIEGAVASVTSQVNDDLNGTVLVVEIRNPNKRYVQAVLTSLTANIGYGDTIAILKPRRFPAEQGATVAAKGYVSP